MFGNNIAGYFLPNPKEEKTNSILFFSDLFKNFLIEKVDLAFFVENNSINLDNLPSPDEFQEQIYVLMKKIVEQIEKDNEDTNTLENDLVESKPDTIVSSNSSFSSIPINPNPNPNTNLKKRIDQYGNIINVPVALPKKGIYTLKDYPNSSSSLSSSSNNNSLVYNSSSSSSNSNIGGNNKNKNINSKKQKKTKKNKNKKKKISQKTRKVKEKVKTKRKSSFLTKKQKKNKMKKNNKSRKLV